MCCDLPLLEGDGASTTSLRILLSGDFLTLLLVPHTHTLPRSDEIWPFPTREGEEEVDSGRSGGGGEGKGRTGQQSSTRCGVRREMKVHTVDLRFRL